MLVGIFADTHDHLDNLRHAVRLFNERACEIVLFAGDLVSTFAVPPLRKLQMKLLGCYGDNEGNRAGLAAGLSLIGTVLDAPAVFTLADGTRVAIAHMERQLRELDLAGIDLVVVGHTHKPSIARDDAGRLWINPGETSGWTYGRPTVAFFDTSTGAAEIVPLDTSIPLPSWDEERRSRSRPSIGAAE